MSGTLKDTGLSSQYSISTHSVSDFFLLQASTKACTRFHLKYFVVVVILPRVKDLEEETLFPFERQEIGRSDLGLDSSSCSSLLPALLHLLQPPAAAAVPPAAPAASFTKLLYPRDASAAGQTSHGESTCIADPPTNKCCQSQKSVIRVEWVATTIINSDSECQGVIQLNIRLTFSATSHLSTGYQNMYFGFSNYDSFAY